MPLPTKNITDAIITADSERLKGLISFISNEWSQSSTIVMKSYGSNDPEAVKAATDALLGFQADLNNLVSDNNLTVGELIQSINGIKDDRAREAVLIALIGSDKTETLLTGDKRISDSEAQQFVDAIAYSADTPFIVWGKDGDEIKEELQASVDKQLADAMLKHFNDAVTNGDVAALKELIGAEYLTGERITKVAESGKAELINAIIESDKVNLSSTDVDTALKSAEATKIATALIANVEGDSLNKDQVATIIALGDATITKSLIDDSNISLAGNVVNIIATKNPELISSVIINDPGAVTPDDIKKLITLDKQQLNPATPSARELIEAVIASDRIDISQNINDFIATNDPELITKVLDSTEVKNNAQLIGEAQLTNIINIKDSDLTLKLINDGKIAKGSASEQAIIDNGDVEAVKAILKGYTDAIATAEKDRDKNKAKEAYLEVLDKVIVSATANNTFNSELAEVALSSKEIKSEKYNELMQSAIAAGQSEWVLGRADLSANMDESTLKALYTHSSDLDGKQRLDLYSTLLTKTFPDDKEKPFGSKHLAVSEEEVKKQIKDMFADVINQYGPNANQDIKDMADKFMTDGNLGITVDDVTAALIENPKAARVFAEKFIKDGRFDIIADMVEKDPEILKAIGDLPVDEKNAGLMKLVEALMKKEGLDAFDITSLPDYSVLAEGFDKDNHTELNLQELSNTELFKDVMDKDIGSQTVGKKTSTNQTYTPGGGH